MGKFGISKYDNFFEIGQKIGNYTVIDNNIVIQHEAKVKCQCRCGVFNLVSCYTLIKGTSTQCLKCGNSLKMENNPSWKGYGDISGRIIGKIKKDAIKRGIIFNLTIEYLDSLYKLQNKKCSLTGLSLNISSKQQTASLDRIDSLNGYVEGNVQWVHKDINMMKKAYNQEYFIEMCKLVANN